MSINTIKHYNEMSTPLPFILYSLWGHIFGFETYSLRVLSILIAFITYIFLHRLFFIIFHNSLIPFLTSAFIIINPYMIGISIFVYTDMLALLFMIICCLSMIKHEPIIFAVSSAAMLLCRQYYVFFTFAALLYYFLRFIIMRKVGPLHMLLACMISFLPFVVLIIMWKGLSPDNSLRNLYMSEGFLFHPNHITLYVSQFVVYLIPFIIFAWRYLYKDVRVLLGSLLPSCFYWFFPVAPSNYALRVGVYTVGYFHRFLKMIFGNSLFEHVIFFVAFLLGLPLLFYIIKDSYLKWKNKDFDFLFFVNLSILSFLIIMSFSYMAWEKYFLAFLPLGAIRILCFKYHDKTLRT